MGTSEGISPGFKAISKPDWELGQSGSDLLPARLPRFPSQEEEAERGLVNSQILPTEKIFLQLLSPATCWCLSG